MVRDNQLREFLEGQRLMYLGVAQSRAERSHQECLKTLENLLSKELVEREVTHGLQQKNQLLQQTLQDSNGVHRER